MSTAFSALADVRQAHRQILAGASPSWAVFAYAATTSTLKLHDSGDDLLDFQDAFDDSLVQYGFLRVRHHDVDKFVLVLWCGAGAPISKKAKIQQHSKDIQQLFRGFHVQIEARSEIDLDPTAIRRRVSAATNAWSTDAHLNAAPQDDVSAGAGAVRDDSVSQEEKEVQRRGLQGPGDQADPLPLRNSTGSTPGGRPDTSLGLPGMSGLGKDARPSLLHETHVGEGLRAHAETKRGIKQGKGPTSDGSSDVSDQDSLVGTSYEPVKTVPRPLRASQTVGFGSTNVNCAALIRARREAEDRALVEREKASSHAAAAFPGEELSRPMQIRREREAEDARLRQREEARLQSLGRGDGSHALPAGGNLRVEVEGYGRQSGHGDGGITRRGELDGARRPKPISSAVEPGSAPSSTPIRRPVIHANWTLPGAPVTGTHPPPSSQAQLSEWKTSKASECADVKNAAEKMDDPHLGEAVPPEGDRLGSVVAPCDYEAAEESELGLAERERLVDAKKPDKDWCFGRNGDGLRVGLFPANHVTERPDLTASSEGQDPRDPIDGPSVVSAEAPAISTESHGGFSSERGIVVVALYDYEAQDSTEITFGEGDHIFHVQKDSPEWWSGSRAGTETFGYFPANYVQEA